MTISIETTPGTAAATGAAAKVGKKVKYVHTGTKAQKLDLRTRARAAFTSYSLNKAYSPRQRQAFIGVYTRTLLGSIGAPAETEAEEKVSIEVTALHLAEKALNALTEKISTKEATSTPSAVPEQEVTKLLNTPLSEWQRMGKRFEKNVKKSEKRKALPARNIRDNSAKSTYTGAGAGAGAGYGAGAGVAGGAQEEEFYEEEEEESSGGKSWWKEKQEENYD